MSNQVAKKQFMWSVSLEYLRRVMALISPTVMMIIVISFAAFKVAESAGESAKIVKILTILPAIVVILSILIALNDLFNQVKSVACMNNFFNFVIVVCYGLLMGLMVAYAVHNAATLYSAISKAVEISNYCIINQ
ncbi:hypothetical protein [Providencia stuartii]|uniref:hypothetical protein n=1 Tax=Providencia stuartii TaxID=588 RepID=UPI00300CDB65